MSVKINIDGFLTGSRTELCVNVEGKTVGECLKAAIKCVPTLEQTLFSDEENLKGFVEILVNGNSCWPLRLNYEVKDGDAVAVFALLAGG